MADTTFLAMLEDLSTDDSIVDIVLDYIEENYPGTVWASNFYKIATGKDVPLFHEEDNQWEELKETCFALEKVFKDQWEGEMLRHLFSKDTKSLRLKYRAKALSKQGKTTIQSMVYDAIVNNNPAAVDALEDWIKERVDPEDYGVHEEHTYTGALASILAAVRIDSQPTQRFISEEIHRGVRESNWAPHYTAAILEALRKIDRRKYRKKALFEPNDAQYMTYEQRVAALIRNTEDNDTPWEIIADAVEDIDVARGEEMYPHHEEVRAVANGPVLEWEEVIEGISDTEFAYASYFAKGARWNYSLVNRSIGGKTWDFFINGRFKKGRLSLEEGKQLAEDWERDTIMEKLRNWFGV